MKRHPYLDFVLAILGLFTSALAATPALAQKAEVPVDITANSMTIYEKEFRAVFIGKVDAIRGEVKLKSDRLDIKYAEVRRKNGSKKTEIRFLNARGNVVIISRGQTIKSQRARMDMRANQALITGNVRVFKGKSTIRGEKLHMNLSTGQSKMIGRVRGNF